MNVNLSRLKPAAILSLKITGMVIIALALVVGLLFGFAALGVVVGQWLGFSAYIAITLGGLLGFVVTLYLTMLIINCIEF